MSVGAVTSLQRPLTRKNEALIAQVPLRAELHPFELVVAQRAARELDGLLVGINCRGERARVLRARPASDGNPGHALLSSVRFLAPTIFVWYSSALRIWSLHRRARVARAERRRPGLFAGALTLRACLQHRTGD